MSLLSADCSVCGYHRRLAEDILRSYKLDEDVRVTIPVAYGWCECCAAVTVVEALPSLAKIDGDIAFVDGEGNGDNSQQCREHLQCLRRWRANRISPAKCLECGSTRFERFEEIEEFNELSDWDEEWRPLIHPGCGGTLTLRGVGFSRSRIWFFYTPEGDKIAAYDVYASRGLVRRPDDA
jgi:Zn ribbon nucleic-acid-binding protein